MYWAIRRELLENRSIYIAPLAAAGVFLFGFMISAFHLAGKIRSASADPMQLAELIERPYTFAAYLLMGTTLVVAIFYCLDALHGERRDRSILFWKSLPVSDLITVLSKASIPVVVLPVITVALTIATHWIMLLLSTAVLLAGGVSPAVIWGHLPLFQIWVMVTFHLLALHGLSYAPAYCWLLLVSGWARRAAFLWAFLPPIAVGVVEKVAFNTSYLVNLLQSHFYEGPEPVPFEAGKMMIHPLTAADVGSFLFNPGLWIGILVAAAFLVAAVRLRRYQGPI
jgi:ABC-2 type transport system permease protein